MKWTVYNMQFFLRFFLLNIALWTYNMQFIFIWTSLFILYMHTLKIYICTYNMQSIFIWNWDWIWKLNAHVRVFAINILKLDYIQFIVAFYLDQIYYFFKICLSYYYTAENEHTFLCPRDGVHNQLRKLNSPPPSLPGLQMLANILQRSAAISLFARLQT